MQMQKNVFYNYFKKSCHGLATGSQHTIRFLHQIHGAEPWSNHSAHFDLVPCLLQ